MIYLLAIVAFADPTVDALETELQRNLAELSLQDADAPWFLSYQLEEKERIRITASLGGIIGEWRTPRRALGVHVRVGDPTVDSSHFGSFWDDRGFDSQTLGMQATPTEIRRAAWLLADTQYKAAVENLSRKIASRRGRLQMKRPPDFSPTEGVQFESDALTLPVGESFRQWCKDLSAVFRDHPAISWSEASCYAEAGRMVIVDSSDTRVLLGEGDDSRRREHPRRRRDLCLGSRHLECEGDHRSSEPRRDEGGDPGHRAAPRGLGRCSRPGG
jgi:hypothetical protein